MALLIDENGPLDPDSLNLSTRKKTWIHNKPAPTRPPASMRAAVDEMLRGRVGVTLRSAASHYNCMGMAFAARRTAIDIDRWPLIRDEDEYRTVLPEEALWIGDVVVYKRDGKVQHVGIITEVRITESEPSIIVLSQWGFDGEYRHPIDQVPQVYGSTYEFWTDRRAKP